MNKLKPEEMVNLTAHELILIVQEARDCAIQIGVQWAEANKRFKDLKELMPTFLAQIQSELLGTCKSLGVVRIHSLAHGVYREKLEKMNEAEREARLLEVEYKAHIKTLEAISAISFVRNNELKLARQG
jgi:hypothetical protein